MYTYSWLTLLHGRNQDNIVKQLYSNNDVKKKEKKKKEKKKKRKKETPIAQTLTGFPESKLLTPFGRC